MTEKFRTIHLGARESTWRLYMTRKADPAFLAFQKKIFIRDQYTCQFCGFQSQQSQEVINFDNNYLNNKISNLGTACPLCLQCFFLDMVGKGDFGGGTLIYLPEMSQNELNALCHVFFYAIASGNSSYETSARNIYRSLKLRSQLVEQEIGEGFSQPGVYGQLLIDTKMPNRKEVAHNLRKKLRLLPDISKFTTQVETWIVEGLKCLSF